MRPTSDDVGVPLADSGASRFRSICMRAPTWPRTGQTFASRARRAGALHKRPDDCGMGALEASRTRCGAGPETGAASEATASLRVSSGLQR